MGRGNRARGEDGFTVVSAMWAMAVTLVLVTWVANLFVHRYAQGVIRQATDEGARAWAVGGGTHDDCLAAADDVMADLLSGSLGADVTITCAAVGDTVHVTASGTLGAIPPLPEASFTATAVVAMELEDGLTTP